MLKYIQFIIRNKCILIVIKKNININNNRKITHLNTHYVILLIARAYYDGVSMTFMFKESPHLSIGWSRSEKAPYIKNPCRLQTFYRPVVQ